MRRALDVRFHDRGREHRLYVDLVADTRYTQEIAHADSGVLSLELPLDIARQRQPATFDHHLDGVCRQGTGPAPQVLGRLRDVGILDLYRQRLHASDALGGSFGIEFLVLAADLTGQRHDASVTTPFFTSTPIFAACTAGSHFSSAITSRCSCESVFMV